MNKLFINITKSSNLKEDQGSPPVTLEDIIKKKKFYPNIDKISKSYESNKKLSFQQETEEHVRQVILSIDGSKVTSVVDILVDMLKVTIDIHLSLITKIISLSFENGCFPDDLKLALKESCTTKSMRSCKINCQTYSFSYTLASARQVTSNEVDFILKSFNTEKASGTYRIPTKFVKLLYIYIFSTLLAIAINNRLTISVFWHR